MAPKVHRVALSLHGLLIVALVSCLASSFVWADEPPKVPLEELQRRLMESEGREALEVGKEIGAAYIYEDPEETRRLLRLALARGDVVGATGEKGKLLRIIGNSLVIQGRLGEADEAYREAIDCLRTAGDAEGVTLTWLNMAVVARRSGRIVEAVEIYRDMIRRNSKVENNGLLHQAQNNLGVIFDGYRLYDEAARHYVASWRAALASGRNPFQPAANAARAYAYLDDEVNAKLFLERAGQSLGRGAGGLLEGSLALATGDVASHFGRWPEAREAFERAYRAFLEVGEGGRRLGWAMCGWVSSKIELDDPTLTKNEVEKCKQLAQSEEADEELGLDAKRVEADYLDRQGRHEAAFDVMDTLHDELSTFYETMGKQQLRLAVAELEGALNRQDVLLAEERAASAELQAERQRVWLLLAGSGSLLLVGLTVLAVVIARQRSQTSEQLRLTAESLEERGRELHHAVKEKEVLLQELNHRVKNNLQVVASLLGLERRRAESVGADFSGMKEVQARVLSMASVHEGIQELGAFDRVDLAAYLRRLSDRLGLVHGAKGQVEPAVSCEPRIDMSAAAPIGLICCELVSNAYEHAYAEGGSVVIALTRDGDGAVLKVSDEGRGLPGDFSLASLDSLGLSLVQDLARQVGTRISWEENSPQGVTWTLPIPGHRLAWG